MPRIDENGIDCRNDKIVTKHFIQSLNGILEKTQHHQNTATFNSNNSNTVQQNTVESPKVFAANSIKVNAPAKDVLGPKFDHFAKNLKQHQHQHQHQPQRQPHAIAMPAESPMLTNKFNGSTNGHTPNGILTNGANHSNSNGNGNGNGQLPRLQPLSACYDRYPKPGSYGSLQVFPMNGVNSEINNAKENKFSGGSPLRHNRRNDGTKANDEMAKLEQDRLEEVLKMCADFERQNQNATASPIVQNRIKTNGSLPREKKSPMSPDHMGSSGGSSVNGGGSGSSGSANVFFPSSPADFRNGHKNASAQQPSSPHTPHKLSTGYENVKLFASRKSADSGSSPSGRFDGVQHQRSGYDSMHATHLTNGNTSNGYENLISPLKSPVGYVPQSPRTRIKTCISPKKELTSTPIQRKTDYDLLVQSFEEKLRLEIHQFRENRTTTKANNAASDNDNRISQNSCQTDQKPEPPQQHQWQHQQQHQIQNQNQHQFQNQQQQQQQQSSSQVPLPSMHQYVNINRSMNLQEGIYGTVATKQKPNNHLTVNIRKNLDEKQIAQLKKQQIDVLRKARDVKAQISELQRQEEEVLRELDLEKALVSAELNTEQSQLDEMEKDMMALQAKIHRLEAQRNANRVLAETQQNKLKQSIDMKQNHIEGLKKLIGENESPSEDDGLKDELNETVQMLENDTKTFEDLEFQYLEEETEWLAYREDLHNEQKTLSRRINEKRKHIKALEMQGIDNQNAACADTKIIEKDLWTMLKELEKYREELKTIDTLLYELSGETGTQSADSDDDVSVTTTTSTATNNHHSPKKRPQFDGLSQSLYGSQEILSQSKKSHYNDLMSKSVNENLFSNKIETLSFVSDHLLTTAEKESDVQLDHYTETDGVKQHSSEKKENMPSDGSVNKNGCVGNKDDDLIADELATSSKVEPIDNDEITTTDDDLSDPLQKLKYNLSPPFSNKATSKASDNNSNDSATKSPNLNLSIESDDFEVNPLEKRVPSQDDIDRICKVTSDAPISTQGASYKVIESIKEIERNRQLLLTQQGSHVIEHERQKMSELKKKSHDEARAQYLQLQNHNDDRYRYKNDDLQTVETINNIITCDAEKKPDLYMNKPMNNCVAQLRENVRHSHPEYDYERPLSEVNSEISYDALSDKQFKSSSDIRMSSSRIQNDYYDGSGGSQRGSMMSSENSDCGRMVSGARRSLPKHQRPLTRYLPIMSADLDLRLHIESAGHQVTLCPHVIIDSFSCRGYLHKLGATFHTWSKRWFVLDRQKGALIYYSDKSERKPRGGAYFTTIDEVYLDHLNTSKSGRPHCTFIVKTKRRSYHLQAASDAAARIWIDAIITGAQGNVDY